MMNITTTTNFRGKILNKVYRVWLVRKFLPVFLIEIIVLSVVIFQFSRLVFVEKVMENFFRILFQKPSGSLTFLSTAFSQSSSLTKVTMIAVIILVALLLRMLTQGFLRLILVRKNYFGKIEQK